MVRDYRGRNKWLPGVIVKQTGPVSFQVEVSTAEGVRVWRRHQDQVIHAKPVESSQSDSWQLPLPDIPVSVVNGSQGPDLDPGVADMASTSQRRYPRRDRRPPDFYSAT